MNTYIRNIIKAICKTNPFNAALYGPHLFIIVDKIQLYIIPLESSPISDTAMIGFDQESIENENYIIDSGCFGSVMDKVNYYNEILNTTPCIYTQDNLQEVPQFQEYIRRKARDGAGFCRIGGPDQNFFFSVFGSLFNLNKDDTINVDIHPDRWDGALLYHYHIYKKKLKLHYDMIMRNVNIGM